MNIVIFDADKQDADFIAKCVLAAVQLYDFTTESPYLEKTIEIVSKENTVFSYRNARIAKIDGNPVGCIISYPGSFYREAIYNTFYDLIYRNSDLECSEDEYYIDSISVVPEFRHKDVGRMLLADAIQKGFSLGFHKVSLIVLDEPNHEHLSNYYISTFGFRATGEKVLLCGNKYNKFVKSTNYRHIVMWKFKGSSDERNEHAMWMKSNLEALSGMIPGLLSIKVLSAPNQQYDALLDTSFISPFFLELYKIHPLHRRISDYCKKSRESRISFDAWD